jgi:carbon storage regulator
MLVLTRKPDQSIMIGNDIEITVLEVRGEQVRLGIRAPRTVAVHRKEVFEQIRQENQTAAASNTELPSLDDLMPPTK